MKLIWSPLAVDRVTEIANYIAKDKPYAAKKWISKEFSQVENLKSLLPKICYNQHKKKDIKWLI